MQVKAAMIVMSIMGCNDGGTHCVPLATSEPKWPTVAACDKESETALQKYTNANYPMIIAICQSPQMAEKTSPVGADGAAENLPETNKPGSVSTAKVEPTLAAKTMDLIEKAIPTTDGIKNAFQTPVHVITNSYSWVVQKFHKE